MDNDFLIDCEEVTRQIKRAKWFPYKTGNLKFNATYGRMVTQDTYCITFDSKVAPYVDYLEYGSQPHDIPNAFGKGYDFGIGGRFNDKFHPGSHKHDGFISNKSVNTIIDFFVKKYNGEMI